MRVFDLLTTSDSEDNPSSRPRTESEDQPRLRRSRTETVRDKIEKYSEPDLDFDQIAMPEIAVSVYFVDKATKLGSINTVAKVKRVLRYHHLTRCRVDDKDYPPNQEYFLYSCGKVKTC